MKVVQDILMGSGKKTSSSVRTLEEIKRELELNEQEIQNTKTGIDDQNSGWADDVEDTSELQWRLEALREQRESLKAEYKSHPNYLEEKYKDASGLEKAVTGIVGSSIATVPVIAETASAAKREAEAKMESEDFMQALQAEKIAWNKLNDYAADYFGSFDMIDQNKLDRLGQEYQNASDYRKKLGEQYEMTVDADSWGMKMMNESAWLKNSATEKLSGFGKTAADTAIDIGQSVALSPLLLLGPKAYLAGTVANASAEDMYAQTKKGKSAGNAMASGLLTAGVEIVGDKVTNIRNPEGKVMLERICKACRDKDVELVTELGAKLLENSAFEFTRESALYMMDYLADRAGRNPNAEFDWGEFVQSAIVNKTLGFTEKETEKLLKEIDWAWND